MLVTDSGSVAPLARLCRQVVCAMSFESGNDLELYPHAELELRAQSRSASREAAAERSAGARRALDDGPACGRMRSE